MADTVDPKYLDKRTAERYLRSGQLDEKALERHLKGLPDVADKAMPVETFMADDVDDFEDDEELDEEEDEAESDEDTTDDAPESPVGGGEEPQTP
ncbi:RNA polymerase subunit sigma [Myxococcus stipitatus]|uniref:RNA polymerase subunit sigma n=1 Tax=Myxococcus stipitatus TaxID=83455 RepID=UPI001F491268|nr:RNA polymerase subunit sigma [Myxococcus stipitatus]MCE9668039.1 RNA polymerase subunit sigma [Myxococcus stipitatus]